MGAQITDLLLNKRIAWNSIRGDIKTSGQVTFNAIDKGETEVTVSLFYVLPADGLGQFVAEIFDNPAEKLDEDLGRFKKYVEEKLATSAASVRT